MYLLKLIITWLIYGIALINAIYFLLKPHRDYPAIFSFGIYIIVGTLIDFSAYATALSGKPNLHFIHLFSFLEFILLSLFFKKVIQLNTQQNKIHNGFILLGMLSIIVLSLFVQPLNQFNSYSSSLVSLTILGFSMKYFMDSLEFQQEMNVYQSAVKWFVISIFMFHCINLVVIFFGNYLLEISKEKNAVVMLIRMLMILFCRTLVFLQVIKLFKKELLVYERK